MTAFYSVVFHRHSYRPDKPSHRQVYHSNVTHETSIQTTRKELKASTQTLRTHAGINMCSSQHNTKETSVSSSIALPHWHYITLRLLTGPLYSPEPQPPQTHCPMTLIVSISSAHSDFCTWYSLKFLPSRSIVRASAAQLLLIHYRAQPMYYSLRYWNINLLRNEFLRQNRIWK